jgi:hypothetical protein
VEVRDRTLSEASAGRDRGRAQFVGTDYAVGETGSAPVHQHTLVQDSDRRHVGQGLGDQQIGPRDLARREENVSAGEVCETCGGPSELISQTIIPWDGNETMAREVSPWTPRCADP